MAVLTLAAASIAGASALAAYGSASEQETPLEGNFTLEQARAFDGFPLYYAGGRIAGVPLVAVLRRNDTANYVSFVYGDCVPVSFDAGCAPPAEIQVWPGERRTIGSYDAAVPGTPVPEESTVRGLPAAFFDGGTRLEIYTGASTVVVFSSSRGKILQIAEALRCLSAAGPSEEPLRC